MRGPRIRFPPSRKTICKRSSTRKYSKMEFFQLLWSLGCIATCVIVIVQRVNYFISTPMTTATEFAQTPTVNYPPAILCRYGFYYNSFRKFFVEEVMKKCENISECRELPTEQILNFPLNNLSINLDFIWDAYGIRYDLIDNEVYCAFLVNESNCNNGSVKNAIRKIIRTALGTCVEYYLDREFEYHGFYTYFALNVRPHVIRPITTDNLNNFSDIWFYLPHNANYSRHEIYYSVRQIPKYCEIEMELSRQKFQFINTPASPCTDQKLVIDCIDTCFEKLLKVAVTCNLPFVQVPHQKNCSTANEALEVYRRADTIYRAVDPSKCQCPKICDNTVLTAITTMQNTKIFDPKLYTTSIFLRYTNNYQMVTTESYLYPSSALISDVGGNIGFFLGLSVLSSFHIIINFVRNLALKWTKRRSIGVYGVRRYNSKRTINKFT